VIRSLGLVLLLGVGPSLVTACANRGEVTAVPDVSTTAMSPQPPAAASTPGAGPSGPPCGTYDVDTTEIIAGQRFPQGRYQIHAFGIPCDDVMGDTGLFRVFLMLDDDAPLPGPWRFLEGAVGAPKFVAGPSVGFRVQMIAS
jgi:hypothetical protein